MNRFDIREHGASILVAALSSTFGVALVLITDALAVMIDSDPATSESHTVRFVLGFIAFVFLAIALYVGAVVTSNTFSTIIAGRTRTIALLRLIGATARDQRRSVAREGLLVGMIGGVVGFALGVGVNALLLGVFVPNLHLPPFMHFNYVTPMAVLPVVAVILTTWLASWIGSRRVLVVSPTQALGAATERSVEDVVSKRGRNAVATTLFLIGTLILIGSVLLGQATPIALLPGVFGGILSFTGVVLAAGVIMPPALRFVGALLGRSAPARMAAQNSLRYPERSARTTVGLVIGVTLVTMFVVALQTVLTLIDISRAQQPQTYEGTAPIISAVAIIFSVIGGFSALIAAVGLVNNMSLSVLQRTRELGLLRTLGFTVRQVRQLIVAESAQLTIAAVLVGLVLGTFYGWAGAECLLGALSGGTGPVAPAIPLLLIAIVVVASLLLTWLASAGPSRRATRVAPVAALAVE
jgi:putative ABC transport system permease protein